MRILMCVFACTGRACGYPNNYTKSKFQQGGEHLSTDFIAFQVHSSVKKLQLTFHFIVNVSYDIFPKPIYIYF